MDVRGKRVWVGLSGGVDSAVSAALLKDAGAHVTGVFIKGWYPEGFACPWTLERRDAMRVAARLQIPFITLDASEEYKKGVIDYLVREYRLGRTPNPDVMCNREVKFGAFYRAARAGGADLIATGHYRSGEKDQSYFLWAVPQEVFAYTLFPVGDKEKSEVRALARDFGLPVASKKDSQGVCFLGDLDITSFLRTVVTTAPGVARDETGVPVGKHEGVLLYTLGERVSLQDARENGPWYVKSKDLEQNVLVVTRDKAQLRSRDALHLEETNWIGDPTRATTVQLRYRGPYLSARVEGDQVILLDESPELPAPGQSLVAYHDRTLLGGGIITA